LSVFSHWTRCRISASLMDWFTKFTYIITHWTRSRISASLLGLADLSVVEQSAEFLHRCWVQKILVCLVIEQDAEFLRHWWFTKFTYIVTHWTRCGISASLLGSVYLSVVEKTAEFLHRCWVQQIWVYLVIEPSAEFLYHWWVH